MKNRKFSGTFVHKLALRKRWSKYFTTFTFNQGISGNRGVSHFVDIYFRLLELRSNSLRKIRKALAQADSLFFYLSYILSLVLD